MGQTVGQSRARRVLAGLRLASPELPLVVVGGLVCAVLGGLLIGVFGRAVLGVPSTLQELKMPGIIPYAFPPVVGCTGGFILAFMVKKPGPHSAHLFYSVGLKIVLIDGLVAMLTLPGSASAGTIITVIAVVFYPLLMMPVMLRFIPRPGLPAAEKTRVHTVPLSRV